MYACLCMRLSIILIYNYSELISVALFMVTKEWMKSQYNKEVACYVIMILFTAVFCHHFNTTPTLLLSDYKTTPPVKL